MKTQVIPSSGVGELVGIEQDGRWVWKSTYPLRPRGGKPQGILIQLTTPTSRPPGPKQLTLAIRLLNLIGGNEPSVRKLLAEQLQGRPELPELFKGRSLSRLLFDPTIIIDKHAEGIVEYTLQLKDMQLTIRIEMNEFNGMIQHIDVGTFPGETGR